MPIAQYLKLRYCQFDNAAQCSIEQLNLSEKIIKIQQNLTAYCHAHELNVQSSWFRRFDWNYNWTLLATRAIIAHRTELFDSNICSHCEITGSVESSNASRAHVRLGITKDLNNLVVAYSILNDQTYVSDLPIKKWSNFASHRCSLRLNRWPLCKPSAMGTILGWFSVCLWCVARWF